LWERCANYAQMNGSLSWHFVGFCSTHFVSMKPTKSYKLKIVYWGFGYSSIVWLWKHVCVINFCKITFPFFNGLLKFKHVN
jgi:hypothetical protein